MKVHPWSSMSLPIERKAGVFGSTRTRALMLSDCMSTSMASVASIISLAVANRTACAFCSIASRSLLGRLDRLTRWLLEPVSRIHTGTLGGRRLS